MKFMTIHITREKESTCFSDFKNKRERKGKDKDLISFSYRVVVVEEFPSSEVN